MDTTVEAQTLDAPRGSSQALAADRYALSVVSEQERTNGGGRARLRRLEGQGGLDVKEPRRPIDLDRAERAVADLLDALGADRRSEGLAATPARVAHAYAELLTPAPFEATTFANDEDYDELVVVSQIPFASLCEHHLLPFGGVAHVGYLPGTRLIGLSKLARVVEHFARRLQLQERLTVQVAAWLGSHLAPRGAGVILEAEHVCMSVRGARTIGAKTVTSAMSGLVRDDQRTRAEFLSLAGGPS